MLGAGLLALWLAGCASPSPSRHAGPTTPVAAPQLPQTVVLEEEVPLAAPPSPGVPSRPALTNGLHASWVALGAWAKQNGLPAPSRIPTNSVAYRIAGDLAQLDVVLGQPALRWERTLSWLGFAPRWSQGELWLHAVDVEKNVIPLLSPTPTLTNRIVVIDPGHGGENAGARSAAFPQFEKEYTLDWALRLRPLLESNGWTVFLTRTNDVDRSLPERVAFADNCSAGLFISLHFNSVPQAPAQAGLETYCLTPKGLPSSITREYADDIYSAHPNNAWDAENLRWAARIHLALLGQAGLQDRGIRRARFMGVLRSQNRPAVLIEAGYLSNPTEARRIAQPDHRQKLAAALAKALDFPSTELAAQESDTLPAMGH